MPTSYPDETRSHYLDALLASSGALHLPIPSGQHHLPLQTIFQPLTLRHGPFSFAGTNREMQHLSSLQGETEGTSVITAHDGAEALTRSPLHRMVVLGGPGMGKTTLLKALLQQAIHNAQTNHLAPLPLFISLPDLARSGQTLEVYLHNILAQLGIDPRYADRLMEAVNEGRAFVCLDSLDEVVPAQRPDMITLINREALRSGGTWIIGSRFTEYKGGQFAHGQFTEWELQPLDRKMRLELARHLLPVLADLLHITPVPSAEDFVEALHQDTRIAAWGENPLLFSLTAMVYVQAGMLPGCRAALYRDISALLLTARTSNQCEREELRLLLSDVALQLYQTRGRNFTVSELLELLSRRSPDLPFQAYIAMITRILDSGLLDVVAYQTYGFKHQMFQEYLAAVALARQFSSQDETERRAAWELAWRKHTYSRWSEVLRLCVGVLVQEYGEQGSQIAAQWLHRLADERNTADGDVGNLCLELALGSLREFGAVPSPTELAEVARTLILIWAELLMKQRMKQTYPDFLHERLGRLVEDVKVLDLHLVMPAIAWLEDVRDHGYQGWDADDASHRAQKILQALDVTVSAKVLASIFPNPQSISLSASTLPTALCKYASMQQLLRLLLDTQAHWRIREGAASLLGAWEDQTPIMVLSAVLEDTTCYYRIRIAAAHALEQQQERMPIERLVALLQHDDDERIRAAAATALANAGEHIPIEPLLAALKDTDLVHDAVWSTLQQLEKLQIAPEPLLSALHSENAALRAAALYLLEDRTPMELLLAALHDPHARVRHAAINVSGKLGDRVPINLLIEALHDQDKDVRRVAVITLGALKKRTPIKPLLEALHDKDAKVRKEAQHALQGSSRSVPTEALITLAHEHSRLKDALEIAGHLHIPLPIELLLAGLNDNPYGTSGHAVCLLASLKEHAPITALLDILHDPFSPARLGAARALTLLTPHVPIEPIFTLTQEVDASNKLYSHLVLLLLRSGAPVPTELLMKAIQTKWHGSYHQKDALVIALGDLGERAPIEALLRMLRNQAARFDWHPDGRALQVLRSVSEWITPQHLLATSHHRIEDEHLALHVLEAMGKSAPTDLIKSVLDDETRDRRLRARARRTLHEAGMYLPLSYFLAEADLGYEGIDGYTTKAMRELGPQAPLEELLDLLVSNETWMQHPSLLERTGNNDDWVHDTVMEALRELVPYLPLETLIATLDHSNPLARKGAARVLGACGERAPINKLMALLHNPRERRVVRAVTLHTLAELQPYTPPEALTAVLRDKDSYIGGTALWLLEKWGRDIPLKPLLALLDDDEYDLRSDAIQALGWLQDRAPVDLLLSLLDSENAQDSESAAKALSRMGKYTPLDVLIAHVYNKDGDIRPAIIEALAHMGEYAPLEMLLQALNNENDEIRKTITYALDDLAEAAPAKFVALAKDDRRAPVREALMQAIAKLGTDAPIELVLAALDDENEDVRFSARRTLLELDLDPAIIPLEPLLHALYEKRNQYDSHWAELDLLAKFGAQAPVEPLLALLGDSNLDICENAARALYQTHPDVFVEVARQAEAILRGQPTGSVFASRVQSRIADRVEWIGRATPAMLAMITDLLDWPYWEVRMKAAQALGAVHRNIPDRAIRRLMELRHNSSSQAVRKAADEALTEILSRETGMEDEES